MAAPTVLSQIRTLVREFTGRHDDTQITDDQIDDKINTFYQYILPNEARVLKLKDVLTIDLVPGIDTYYVNPNEWVSLQTPLYFDGFESQLYQDPTSFYRQWSNLVYSVEGATGDGTIGPYTFTVPNAPFLRSTRQGDFISGAAQKAYNQNVTITANLSASAGMVVTDEPYDPTSPSYSSTSSLTGDGSGSINFDTGEITVTFNQAVPSGTLIYANVIPFAGSRPRSALWFQQQLVVRSVPDRSYKLQIEGYRVPTALLNTSGRNSPEIESMCLLLAYGAAELIFIGNGDFNQQSPFRALWMEQVDYLQRRGLKNIMNERPSTIYASSTSAQNANFYPFIGG